MKRKVLSIIVLFVLLTSCNRPQATPSDITTGTVVTAPVTQATDAIYTFLRGVDRRTATVSDDRFILNDSVKNQVVDCLERKTDYADMYETTLLGVKSTARATNPAQDYLIITIRSVYLLKGAQGKFIDTIYENYYLLNIDHDWKITKCTDAYFTPASYFVTLPLKAKSKKDPSMDAGAIALINETAAAVIQNKRLTIGDSFGTLYAATKQQFRTDFTLEGSIIKNGVSIQNIANVNAYYKCLVTVSSDNGDKRKLKTDYRQFETSYYIDVLNIDGEGWKILDCEFVSHEQVVV